MDEVIMAPEMIETIEQADKQLTKLNIYLVSEDWAVDGESDHSVTPCTDYHTAKRILCEKLARSWMLGAFHCGTIMNLSEPRQGAIITNAGWMVNTAKATMKSPWYRKHSDVSADCRDNWSQLYRPMPS